MQMGATATKILLGTLLKLLLFVAISGEYGVLGWEIHQFVANRDVLYTAQLQGRSAGTTAFHATANSADHQVRRTGKVGAGRDSGRPPGEPSTEPFSKNAFLSAIQAARKGGKDRRFGQLGAVHVSRSRVSNWAQPCCAWPEHDRQVTLIKSRTSNSSTNQFPQCAYSTGSGSAANSRVQMASRSSARRFDKALQKMSL